MLAGCTSSDGNGGKGGGFVGAAGAPAGVSGAAGTLGTAGASAAAGTPPTAGNSAGGSSGGDQGAVGVQCGSGFCAPPMSCCRAAGSSATPSCVIACDDSQEQLCSGTADCQGSDNAACVNGVCQDMPSDAGIADPGDGGPVVFFDGGAPDNGMMIPDGYPMPTAANYAKCQKVPVSAKACAGDPSSNVCIQCLFGGSSYNNNLTPDAAGTAAAGNYLVTVQLGGAAAAKTTISAESQRGLLAQVSTAANETATYAFAVNVRAMEGQPNHAGGPGGYPGLDLFFSGPAATPPQVSAVGYALATAAQRPVTLFIASDSTTCDQTGGEYGGWGQMISEFFAPPLTVANYANSGASSASFLGGSGLWSGITSHWKAGDYVIIQFGHNDKGVTDAAVQTNLEKYVTQAKAANVTPIIVSPPARVSFSGTMETDQSSLHAAAAKKAATAQNVAYIDLTALSTAWYNTLGSKSAAMAFHAGGTDATHTNLPGAAKIASLVAGAIQTQNLPIAKYLR
ncbi:MAG: GDSL-type esterase/lipase family protein [Myxococcales bacterium]